MPVRSRPIRRRQKARNGYYLERVRQLDARQKTLDWESGAIAAVADLSSLLISTNSVDAISDLVLKKAKDLTGSRFGFVGYIDAATGYMISPTLTRDIWDTCQVAGKSPVFQRFSGLWGWVLDNRRTLMTNDPTGDPRSSGVPGGHIPIQRFLGVPALVGDELMGQVALANPGRDFTERDQALVERLAALYALAVQRARVEAALRESEERFTTVVNSLQALIYVADMETYELLFVNEFVRQAFGNVEGSVCWRSLQSGQTGPCDFCTNPRLLKDGQPAGLVEWEFQNTITGRWYYLQDRAIRWPDGRLVRLEVGTDITALKETEIALRRNQVMMAALEERERIAQELHDDLAQVIAYIGMQTQVALARLEKGKTGQALEALCKLNEIAQEAQEDIRGYILGIRNSAGHRPRNFFAELDNYLHMLHERFELEVALSLPENWHTSPLAPEVEGQLLRILQEAFNNVRKHAGVKTARLTFTEQPGEVQVEIADDGAGFDPGQVYAPNHFGLEIMRERAESAGGSLEMRSHPGQGTTLIVRLPVCLPGSETGEEADAIQDVRTLLVDDHPLYLEGLRSLLTARGLQVVGLAQSGEEALHRARELHPELVLMDIHMPGIGGIEATRRIKAELSDVRVIMLTIAAESDLLLQALQNGASGYLLKSLPGPEFFRLLTSAIQGETVLSPTLASQALQAFAQELPTSTEGAEPGRERPTLTARQREVLVLVAQGLSNKEIAAALSITESTVKYHVGQILERLQLQNRYEAARYAGGYGKQ